MPCLHEARVPRIIIERVAQFAQRLRNDIRRQRGMRLPTALHQFIETGHRRRTFQQLPKHSLRLAMQLNRQVWVDQEATRGVDFKFAKQKLHRTRRPVLARGGPQIRANQSAIPRPTHSRRMSGKRRSIENWKSAGFPDRHLTRSWDQQNGGYRWTRTTDPGIMSAVL